MQNQMQAFAQEYHDQNLIVFPVNVVAGANDKAGKYPLRNNWQNTTLEDFKTMDWTNANAIGLLTGKANGIIVLDLDLGHDIKGMHMPVTPCQRTGSGGYHHFFKYIEGVKNAVGLMNKVDIRSDGGYVVIAPSWHPKGEYEWMLKLGEVTLADAPQWLQEKLNVRKQHVKHDATLAFGAPEGTRNDSAAKVIGHILASIHPNYWLDFGLAGLREWNKRNNPPLPDEEIVATYKSIASRQYAQRTKK